MSQSGLQVSSSDPTRSAADQQRAAESRILIDRLLAGEASEESFAGIFSRYYGPIFRFFKNRGFTHEEGHDLTQEVFLRVHQNVSRLASAGSFEGWLFKIAANVWRNELRRRSALSRDADEVSLEGAAGERRELVEVIESAPGAVPPESRDPLGQTLETERRQLLRRAFLELPDRMRMCMMLRIDRDMSYREIAEVMRVSIQTVRRQLFEGRERLKDHLRA